MSKIIQNGGYQNPLGTPLNGNLLLILSQDAKVAASPNQIAPLSVRIPISGGNIAPTLIYFNDELLPGNTFYTLTAYDSAGNKVYGPEQVSFAGAGPLDLGTLTPLLISPDPLFSNPVLQNPAISQTITGQALILTSSAPLFPSSISSVVFVDNANHPGWAGTDACAWINSAQSSVNGLNGGYGIVDARGLSGTITCAGTLAIGSTTQGVRLLLNNGVRLVVQNTVTVAQASAILGSSNNNGSVGTALTAIQAGNSFPTSGIYLITAGPASGVADAVTVRDLFVDCAGVTGCKGMVIQNVQENSDFTNITIIHNLGNGMDIIGASEDFKVQGVNVIAGSGATADNCFTLGTTANHIFFDTDGCTSQNGSPSTGAGILCTGCNMEVTGFHVENHVDGVLLSGASPNHGYVVINGINNSVAMTSLVHVASNWQGTLALFGARLFVGTNTVKNDVSAFNHVCTDAVVNKYLLGPNVGQTGPISLDTDCSSLPTIRSATFAISGTTAGNFTPDATALFDIRGPSATFNGVRLTDTTSGNSYYFGPGAGVSTFGVRDQLNAKNLANFAGNASGGTLILPTANVATTAQGAGNIPVLCGVTSQKSETAADANVLTFAPPATAGLYRVRFVLSLSAANAATLGWTATWTDSNGNAQAPANLALFQTGVAAPALTFTTSAVADYYGEAVIDVNNAAVAIVVKLTFSGTSFTGKASAIVERLI